ncbi:hypothetical protein [Hyphomonas chukchiensis]|uniref:Uncharacterized protein n=1 Tax=Hyphomonas chukchiensis TaxID=1280947 RepID=A0A062UNR8_9PROT|nr:hypothetical protein [Hyphomonas chukchiensis]KCZ58903.1 hypothetical protein HY30_03955 [Hyphomonas chukchiensis]
MLRLISILLLLGGIAAAVFGGAAVMNKYGPPQSMDMATESAPATMEEMAEAPMPEAVEAAPAPELAMEPEPEAMEAAPEAMAKAAPEAMDDAPMASAPAPETRSMSTSRSLSPPITADDETASVASVQDAFDEAGDVAEEAFADIGDAADAVAEAAGVAAPPPPSKSHAEAFMESLQTVPVAHETPRTAEYKRAFDVTLALDATGDDTAVDALPNRGGNIVTGEAKVSERVEARLSGANFEIVEMSPGIQKLSPLTENVWRWSVMPLSAGDHDLVFEIYAIDQDSVVPLRTFRDTVTVQVSGLNRAIAFADQANPLFVLLGGLGSAIAGLLGAVKFFGRR